MPPQILPYTTWADVYDFFYEEAYQDIYSDLTKSNLSLITENLCADEKASIIDFGAGTGRLSIELAKMGHHVTAVEPCSQMLDVLKNKANHHGLTVDTICGKISDYNVTTTNDIAICVFSVISHLLDEGEFTASCEIMAKSIKPGGSLILDIPKREAFCSGRIKNENIDRQWHVELIDKAQGLFKYKENSLDLRPTPPVSYTDTFLIRHWEFKKVISLMNKLGLTVEKKIEILALNYILFRKECTNIENV
jgi:2-polyprenyl-3-methyl-5-hydroxy-6-metoxy-1,4-benzoquinol methylase